jgi:hypothetical protein
MLINDEPLNKHLQFGMETDHRHPVHYVWQPLYHSTANCYEI